MAVDALWQQMRLPLQTPRRKGKTSAEYFGICAIDGKFSAYIAQSPFHRPGAKTALATKRRGIRQVRDVKDAWNQDVKAKIKLNTRSVLKRPICRYHREINELHVPKRTRGSVGPTTIESKLLCPEQHLWNRDPRLKGRLKTSNALVVGSVVHKVAADYAKKGVLIEDGHNGVEGWVNLAITNPGALGISHPLQDASPVNLKRIKEKAVRIVRTAIHQGAIQTLAQIYLDESVVFAEVEMPVAVSLSQMVRDLAGLQSPLRYDVVLDGQIDRIIIRSLPGLLRIHIRDWKSRSNMPTTDEIQIFEKALQMRLYGSWALWTGLTKLEDLPKIEVVLEHSFLSEEGSLTNVTTFGQEEMRLALREVYTYLKGEAEAKTYEKEHGWFRMAQDKYQPKTGPYCINCSAYLLCSATRSPDAKKTFIDQIMPRRKGQEETLNFD